MPTMSVQVLIWYVIIYVNVLIITSIPLFGIAKVEAERTKSRFSRIRILINCSYCPLKDLPPANHKIPM